MMVSIPRSYVSVRPSSLKHHFAGQPDIIIVPCIVYGRESQLVRDRMVASMLIADC